MEKYAFVQMSVYKPRIENGSQVPIVHYKVPSPLPNLSRGGKKKALTGSTFNLRSAAMFFFL